MRLKCSATRPSLLTELHDSLKSANRITSLFVRPESDLRVPNDDSPPPTAEVHIKSWALVLFDGLNVPWLRAGKIGGPGRVQVQVIGRMERFMGDKIDIYTDLYSMGLRNYRRCGDRDFIT